MRSLSLRLTVFIAAAMAAVMLLLGWAVFTVLADEVNQQAIGTAETVANAIVLRILSHGADVGDAVTPSSTAFLFGSRPDQTIVQIAWPGLVQRSQTPGLPMPKQPAAAVTGMITYQGAPASYVSVPVPHTAGAVSVQVSVSLRASEEALTLLRGLLIRVGLAGVLLLSLVGYLFTRRALRPVGRLTRVAMQISETDLSQRLEEPRGRDEISELAQAFNRMLDRLHAAFQRQSRFVSDASHELRTPLAVISGYAELLDRWGVMQEDVRTEAVGAIGREAGRLQRLVQDLLMLARGAQGLQLSLTYFDLSELVSETVQEAEALRSGRLVIDATREVVPVHADLDLVKQLLWILLDNAIKFTPEGRRVEVQALQDGGAAVLSVRDEGPGMSEEARSHAFERFYRADPARLSGAGVGLGLAIAKEIADAHRADLQIESEQGTGTTLRLRLRLAPAAPSPEEDSAQPAKEALLAAEKTTKKRPGRRLPSGREKTQDQREGL